MFDVTIIIGICLAAFGALAWWQRPRVLFTIRIDGHGVHTVRGEVPAAFVKDLERLRGFWRIESGEVRGMRGARGVKLIARGGAAAYEQAIRNAWNHPLADS